MTPIRGQVVVIANPGIEEFYIDHTVASLDVIYMFPHREHGRPRRYRRPG